MLLYQKQIVWWNRLQNPCKLKLHYDECQALTLGGLQGAGTPPQGSLFRPATTSSPTDVSAAFGTFGAESVNDVVNTGNINAANLGVQVL